MQKTVDSNWNNFFKDGLIFSETHVLYVHVSYMSQYMYYMSLILSKQKLQNYKYVSYRMYTLNSYYYIYMS